MNKEKIAVCLPSYNEAKNIKKITSKVDNALNSLGNNYICYIVNCDNNSPDDTNLVFNNTKTKCIKISIVTDEIGKGINIINFFKFCKKEEIDYAFMFDTDLKSFKTLWIKQMMKSLKNGHNFILPLYKRSRYEGNTTNHFVVPILCALFNKIIRQPIGGDYGFDKKYIELFNKQNIPDEIKKYGIDIYMVFLAISDNLNLEQIKLGVKIHSPSYKKMKYIFLDVANGLKYSLIYYNFKSIKNININSIEKYISISTRKNIKAYNYLMKKERKKIINCSYYDAYNEWVKCLSYFILNINSISQYEIEKISNKFITYTLLYWKKYRFKSKKKCEKQIYDLSNDLRKII